MNVQIIVIIAAVLSTIVMSNGTILPWDTLENKRATAFLVAGLLWLVDTILLGLELFAGVSVLGTRGPVNPLLYMSGLLAAIVGLLGLYPELASRSPRLARVGAGVIAVAGIVIPILLAWLVVGALLNQPGPAAPLGILFFVVVALGFILFGISSIWTGVPSRVAGLLLLAIPTAIFVWITAGFVVYGGAVPVWMAPTIAAVITVILLAIGTHLRTEDVPTDRSEQAPTSTVR